MGTGYETSSYKTVHADAKVVSSGGFYYHKNKDGPKAVYYRCSLYREKCKGPDVLVHIAGHNHDTKAYNTEL